MVVGSRRRLRRFASSRRALSVLEAQQRIKILLLYSAIFGLFRVACAGRAVSDPLDYETGIVFDKKWRARQKKGKRILL